MIDVRFEERLKSELLGWMSDNPPKDGDWTSISQSIALATAKNDREENQDRAVFARFISPRPERCFSLMAVLDGIGGMIDGGRCAEISIASIICNLIKLKRAEHRISLVEALALANQDVLQEYRGRGGATFAGVFFENHVAKVINVGDSRIYRYDPERGLARHSSDDRLGDRFAKLKGLENVELNPNLADRLGQYLGMPGRIQPNVRIIDDLLFRTPGGLLLASTDGAHASGDEFIAETFRRGERPKLIVHQLVERAAAGPHADNATAICATSDTFETTRTENPPQGVESLRLWIAGATFTFLCGFTEYSPPPTRTYKAKEKPRKYNKKKRNKHSKFPQETPSISSETPSAAQNDPRTQVTIEQLTFDQTSDDEASD